MSVADSVAVPTCVPATVSVTTSPATGAVPPAPLSAIRTVGVASLVMPSPKVPLSLAAVSVIVGAAGGTVSMVSASVPAVETVPALFVTVAVMVRAPSTNAIVVMLTKVAAMSPLVSVAVPTVVPPTVRVTTSPAAAPEKSTRMVGVASLVTRSAVEPLLLAAVSVGTGVPGVLVLMVSVRLPAGDVLPATSVTVAAMVREPAASALVVMST